MSKLAVDAKLKAVLKKSSSNHKRDESKKSIKISCLSNSRPASEREMMLLPSTENILDQLNKDDAKKTEIVENNDNVGNAVKALSELSDGEGLGPEPRSLKMSMSKTLRLKAKPSIQNQ